MNKYLSLKNISRIAVLGAIGGLLMLIKFPIPIAPSFYKMDFADLPCLIGAFAMGPIPALFIQIIKIIVKLALDPTKTAFVGEIAAFLFSSIYCVSAAIIYNHNKTKKNALLAIIIASILMVLLAGILNYTFIIPAYSRLYGMRIEDIIAMGSAIFPIISDKFSFVLYCVVPFNVIKTIIVDIFTLLLYKRISILLK